MKHTTLLAALAALPLCGGAQGTATTNDTQKGETTMPYVTLNDGNRMPQLVSGLDKNRRNFHKNDPESFPW